MPIGQKDESGRLLESEGPSPETMGGEYQGDCDKAAVIVG